LGKASLYWYAFWGKRREWEMGGGKARKGREVMSPTLVTTTEACAKSFVRRTWTAKTGKIRGGECKEVA